MRKKPGKEAPPPEPTREEIAAWAEALTEEQAEALPVTKTRIPLLRWPPGEGPLYQGSKRWR
jgi:hypothetical protein